MSESCQAPAPRPKTNSSTPRNSRSSATRPCSMSLAYETRRFRWGCLGFVGMRRVFFAAIWVAVPCLGGLKSGTEVATANKLAGKDPTGLDSWTFEPEDFCFDVGFPG